MTRLICLFLVSLAAFGQALPSCTSDSVSVTDMAAGKCSCPAAQPGVQTTATFVWTGGQGQFTIPVNASGVFNWFSSKQCHKYGIFWSLDQDGKPVPVAKLPQPQWALNMFSMHFQESLIKPLNALCKEDDSCKSNLPDLATAAEQKKAAEAAEAAKAAQAAAEALQPK